MAKKPSKQPARHARAGPQLQHPGFLSYGAPELREPPLGSPDRTLFFTGAPAFDIDSFLRHSRCPGKPRSRDLGVQPFQLCCYHTKRTVPFSGFAPITGCIEACITAGNYSKCK
jgi:hypothetical protein